MSSTVTVSTVSTVTATAFFASLGLVVAVTLLLLIIKKEIFTNSTHPWAIALSKVLNVAIIPLLMAFGMIAVVNMIEIMR